MPEILAASQLSLGDVEEKFHLQEVHDREWFREWQGEFAEPTLPERHWLDQVRSDFLALSKYPLHEEIVKLVVLAPLLSIAGLCRPPFLPVAEKQVAIEVEATDELIRGRVDILILHKQLWVTTIESKRHSIDIRQALPQALIYLLSNPNVTQPTYGLVTNGNHFIFIKLVAGNMPQYAISEEFSVWRSTNELYSVVGILKRLATVATQAIAA